jgi:L-aspartate oxidase
METRIRTNVLVIGSGIAGCTAALLLADEGYETTLLTTGKALDTGNTALAQGGIVFRAMENDPGQLEEDIIEGGRRHNYLPAVRYLSRKGPQAVRDILLHRLNIPFVRGDNCEWDLRIEGGHGERRILHCADYTGRAIMDGLMAAVAKQPNIRVLYEHTAVDLLTSHHQSRNLEFKYQTVNQCVGAYAFDDQTKSVRTILADFTVLATGGVGQVFLHTTNAPCSIGSGLSMAFRAGAGIMNSEFVQFHPTALYHKSERRFLITEALRGEGARLINSDGEPFMHRFDERGDLAPRDVVSRAIMEEMLLTGEPCVFLDVAHFVETDVTQRFPTIFDKCMRIGIDIRRDPIPVVPAAHYFCGGILADTRARTTLERLYAAGECSCTGVHGANRLASTSLLEGLLWGVTSARDICRRLKVRQFVRNKLFDSIPDWQSPGENQNEDPALIAQDWSTLRNTMWNYVGIVRNSQRLQRATDDLRNLFKNLLDFYKRTPLSKNIIDLVHGAQAAYNITHAAKRNKHSIGCHFRSD